MDTPIISPWIFYLMKIADRTLWCMQGIFIIGILSAIFVPLWIEDVKYGKKYIKYILISILISLLGIIFIPDSNTITKMYIANNITVSNMEKAGDIADRIVDKVIEKNQ